MRACSALLIALVACGGASTATLDAPGDGAAAGDAAPGPDATVVPPITAPSEAWTWVPIDGMQCADGSPTGVGVNLTDRSQKIMIYLQGGGACWDATTCFTVMSATHITGGYGAAEFTTEIASVGQSYLFQRTADNPFKDASWIYVPYCTGDLHAGAATATYNDATGAHVVHHVGRINAATVFARAAATRPTADTVWLVGVSAGGFGVAFDFAAARAAWPSGIAFRGLADSAPLVQMESTRWAAMQASWGLQFPAGCTGCATDLGALPAALRGLMRPTDRYGLLANTQDQTISTYFALTGPALATAIAAEQAAMPAGSGQAAWLINGTSHVVLSNPAQIAGGESAQAWIAQWATADAAWANTGP
jgi:hypothetical protein